MSHFRRPGAIVHGVLGIAPALALVPAVPARAGTIVSYTMTAGISGYGSNGAGYSAAVLAAPWELRFAFDTGIVGQVGGGGTTTTYSPLANQVFLQVRVGGGSTDRYTVGPGLAVGAIAVTHASGSTTDTLQTALSPTAVLQPSLQLFIRYPTVVPMALPASLPASSFQFDPSLSSFRLFRTGAQDFYDLDLGNLRPALSPFCPPDFNLSGTLSVQDIFDFLAAYFGSNPLADFNGTGGISVQDIFDFLAAYFAGCP